MFVLSAGHGSMLMYSLLYLLGYEDIDIEDIKNFRQLGAKTAGHPEYGHLLGIDMTTGPLGQGISSAVGMALAERIINAKYGDKLCSHYTYVINGDGCLMEGISQEAAELAGHLKLNKLIVLWDNNNITIDGSVDKASSTNQLLRFEAMGWNTLEIDGHNYEEIEKAIIKAQQSDKPTIISCKTKIGFGAPNKCGTSKCHGSPLGQEEIEGMRKALNWEHAPFEIPAEILESWKKAGEKRTLSLEERESIHSKLFQELKRLGLENPLTGYRYDFNQWLCLCVNATMKNAHETDGAGKRNGTTAEERRQFKLKKFVQEFYKENKVIPTLVQTMIGLKWDEKKVTNTINNGKIDFKEVIEEDLQDLEANGRFQTASIEALQEAGFQAEEFEQRDMETEISLKDLMLALKGHVDPVEIDKKTGEIKKPKRSHENANLYFAMRAIAFHEVITEDMVKRDAAGNILFRNKRVVNGARERIIKVPVIVATGYNKKEATTSDLISTIKYRRMLAGIDKEPIELKVWDITQIKQKIGNYMHQVGICPVNTMEEEPALSM